MKWIKAIFGLDITTTSRDAVPDETASQVCRDELIVQLRSEIREELLPVVRSEIYSEVVETIRNEISGDLYDELLVKVEDDVRKSVREKLISEVSLSDEEIEFYKHSKIMAIKLTDNEMDKQRRLLKEEFTNRQRDHIFKEMESLSEVNRKKFIDEYLDRQSASIRQDFVNEHRETVIKELQRRHRPYIEGCIRNELTINILDELAHSGEFPQSAKARQIRFNLTKGLTEEIRIQEFQNAIFHIAEIVYQASFLQENIKGKLTELIRSTAYPPRHLEGGKSISRH